MLSANNRSNREIFQANGKVNKTTHKLNLSFIAVVFEKQMGCAREGECLVFCENDRSKYTMHESILWTYIRLSAVAFGHLPCSPCIWNRRYSNEYRTIFISSTSAVSYPSVLCCNVNRYGCARPASVCPLRERQPRIQLNEWVRWCIDSIDCISNKNTASLSLSFFSSYFTLSLKRRANGIHVFVTCQALAGNCLWWW